MEILSPSGAISRLPSSAAQVKDIPEDVAEAPQPAEILKGKTSLKRLFKSSALKTPAEVKAPGSPWAKLPELVVLLLFLGVAQHLIGFRDFLKLVLGSFISWMGIGMILLGQLSICFFDLIGTGLFAHPEDFIVVFVGHLICQFPLVSY